MNSSARLRAGFTSDQPKDKKRVLSITVGIFLAKFSLRSSGTASYANDVPLVDLRRSIRLASSGFIVSTLSGAA
jgi:hypothetical protein